MKCYSKRCVNILTLVLAIVIFMQTNLLMVKLLSTNSKTAISEDIQLKISKLEEKLNKTQESDVQIDEWKLIIPKINVSGIIKDGVEAETINNYIGHFEDTPTLDGNIRYSSSK